jgi:biopolymer transport protein ExbB/TolQ
MLFLYDIDGSSFMNEVQKYIIDSDVKGAIKMCSNSKAALPKVFKNALKRANANTDQIQNAIDATAMECVYKVEKRLHYLSLIANIATLLGLLGTIYGLIQSFQSVANVDPAQKAELLAKGISKAMNTTAMGLMAAISIMVPHSLLTGKCDKIIGEVDTYGIRLLDLLGTKIIEDDKK